MLKQKEKNEPQKTQNGQDHNPHQGHRLRVRRRYAAEGSFDSFAGHEVLEFLLFHTIPRTDTNALAHDLLRRYGSFSAVLEASVEELQKNGLGFNSAVLLNAIPSLARYYEKDRLRDKVFLNSLETRVAYARSLFIGRTEELFYLICLNAQSKVNHTVMLGKGTVNEVPVYPRLAVDEALRHKAVSVILAHNHPGLGVTPSAGDMSLTRKINSLLGAISIKVLDHIIICGDDYFSFAEKELLF